MIFNTICSEKKMSTNTKCSKLCRVTTRLLLVVPLELLNLDILTSFMWSTLTSILHYTGGWILFGKIYRFKVDYVMVNACKQMQSLKSYFFGHLHRPLLSSESNPLNFSSGRNYTLIVKHLLFSQTLPACSRELQGKTVEGVKPAKPKLKKEEIHYEL